MTGETIQSLLEPLIGKSGSITLLVSDVGPISFATGATRKLMGVELRPDGLVHITRESGWTVIDPAGVVAVVWNGDAETSPGLFL